MENFNFSSLSGFSFFLLIIVVGYILVEVVGYKIYPFRMVIDRNNKNILDRIIHYVFWGIVGNIAFFYLNYFAKTFSIWVDVFNSSAGLAMEIEKSFGVSANTFQIAIFVGFYFIQFILVLVVFGSLFLSLDFFVLQFKKYMNYRKNIKIQLKENNKKKWLRKFFKKLK